MIGAIITVGQVDVLAFLVKKLYYFVKIGGCMATIPTLHWHEIFGDAQSAIPIRRITERHYFYPLHRHDFLELVIVLAGSGQQIIGETAYPIAAGDVFVFHAPDAHAFTTTTDIDLVNICPRPGMPFPYEDEFRKLPGYHVLFRLEPQYRRSHQFRSRLHLTADQLAHLVPLLEQMCVEVQQCSPGYTAILAALYTEVVVYLSRCYSTLTIPTSRFLLQVGGLLSYLEQHYAEAITLFELATRAHMSPSSVLRAFHRATGMAPMAYLLHLRVQHAAQLLRDTEMSVTDIATRVGFASSSYFSRQFTQQIGVSPRAYRRRMPPRG